MFSMFKKVEEMVNIMGREKDPNRTSGVGNEMKNTLMRLTADEALQISELENIAIETIQNENRRENGKINRVSMTKTGTVVTDKNSLTYI